MKIISGNIYRISNITKKITPNDMQIAYNKLQNNIAGKQFNNITAIKHPKRNEIIFLTDDFANYCCQKLEKVKENFGAKFQKRSAEILDRMLKFESKIPTAIQGKLF